MIIPAYNLTEPLWLKPSKWLVQLITLGHLLGAIATLSNNLSLPLQLFLLALLSGHYLIALHHWCHRPTLKLYCHHDGWLLSTSCSEPPLYTVLKCSYWHPLLVILLVEDRSHKKRYLPLLVDTCPQPEFKRLQLIAATSLNASEKS